MRITGADCLVLSSPPANADPLNTAHDNSLVRVYTEQGITGIGEVECNPWVIKALIEASGYHLADRSLAQLLIGQDPTQPAAVWERLYRQSILTGRRGAGICAIGAIDMALWDIYGKAMRKPVWQLLGGAVCESVMPYASLLPYGETLEQYRANLIGKVIWAREAGFRAIKAEILIHGPYAQPGLDESDDAIVSLAADFRDAAGPDVDLLIDVGYCWDDWKQALRVIQRLERLNPYLLETPLSPDDVQGYAQLCAASDIPIAAGELLSTRFEFEHWLEHDAIDVVQPDIGRVGGITEAMRVAALARDHGKPVVPHCWKSGIGIAATAHVAGAAGCPMIEFLPAPVSNSRLRQSLLENDLTPVNGKIDLPTAPGLGIKLRWETVEGCAIAQAPLPLYV